MALLGRVGIAAGWSPVWEREVMGTVNQEEQHNESLTII